MLQNNTYFCLWKIYEKSMEFSRIKSKVVIKLTLVFNAAREMFLGVI